MPVLNLSPARQYFDHVRLSVTDLTTDTDRWRATQLLAERFELTDVEAATVLAGLIGEVPA